MLPRIRVAAAVIWRSQVLDAEVADLISHKLVMQLLLPTTLAVPKTLTLGPDGCSSVLVIPASLMSGPRSPHDTWAAQRASLIHR